MEPGLQRILSESSDLSLKTAMVFFIKTTTCKKNVLFSGSLHPTFSYFFVVSASEISLCVGVKQMDSEEKCRTQKECKINNTATHKRDTKRLTAIKKQKKILSNKFIKLC